MGKLVFYCSFLILLSFFTSCEDEETPVVDSIWQVYEENNGGKYEGSRPLYGEPYIPGTLLEGGYLPGEYRQPTNKPWIIQAPITDGILSIDFPETLVLNNEYSSEHTGGIKISLLKIWDVDWENTKWFELALVKRVSSSSYSKVYIYFTDKDFTYKTGDGTEIQLKAGWHFWNHNNGIISQDINDFLNLGFRWRRVTLGN